jgi:hypothetical protein
LFGREFCHRGARGRQGGAQFGEQRCSVGTGTREGDGAAIRGFQGEDEGGAGHRSGSVYDLGPERAQSQGGEENAIPGGETEAPPRSLRYVLASEEAP